MLFSSTEVFRPWFSFFTGAILSLIQPFPMDMGNTAERIRAVLDGSSPGTQRQLLRNLLNSVPFGISEPAKPSILVAEDYLKIFRHLLFSAISPHCGTPIPPWNNGIARRTMAWDWVFSQVQEQMAQDDWIHREYLPRIQSRARQVLVIWASCDFPLRACWRMLAQFGLAIPPRMLRFLHACWRSSV